ncbi:MAG: MerR family transcriptional regulator [Pseudomonadota bacterium]
MAAERLSRQPDSPASPARYRMRDLVRESGLPRETIHYYLAEGLLPPPLKTGRNTALYSEDHLYRLGKIQELRERHFLPLKAIRAVLEGEVDQVRTFTPAQRELIRDVSASLRGTLIDHSNPGATAALLDGRVSLEDVRELEAAGLIEVKWQNGEPLLEPNDAAIVEAWALMIESGISRDRGFRPRHAALYQQAIDRMVRAEMELFVERYADVDVAEAAAVVQRALSHIERLISALHRKTLLALIERMAAQGAARDGDAAAAPAG